MAKNSIRDYSATNSSNTDIQSIDISEGCSPAGINNAIREVMADLKDVSTGAVALESPAMDSLTVDTTGIVYSGGSVGIGTSSPVANNAGARTLQMDGAGFGVDIRLTNTATGATASNGSAVVLDSTNFYLWNYENAFTAFGTNNAERLRIDSSGNLLVGKTDTTNLLTTAGHVFYGNGEAFLTRAGTPLFLGRTGSDGNIANFYKDGTTVGSIGVDNTDNLVIEGNSGHSGIQFGTNALLPHKNGAVADNLIDLGSPTERFDDIYATNGTIQTSDQNEKQQIAALTDAEITAAKAISALFKTFKWNSAVTEKGDASRTHAGVIAQDVQAAMTAAGLDAGDYAFFISSTWWETQTEVPAVEAADAVLDEDGNVVTEAVEAADAYTRTDTYETAEEAPEGATERTRLGIRYPELLAFVGAATEQRLANIETRLAALEAN